MNLSPVVVLALLAGSAFGQSNETVTVTTSQDVVDFSQPQTIAQLPGPDGVVSFREAVLAADNTAGPQTVAFAVPVSNWDTIYTDRLILRLEDAIRIFQPDLTIDFTTQTAATGDTNADGTEVGLMFAGVPSNLPFIMVMADRVTVRGLDVAFGNAFGGAVSISSANDCRIVGWTGYADLKIHGWGEGASGNVVGGTTEADKNRLGNVDVLSGASGNVFTGNHVRFGMRIAGDTLYGACNNNRVGGPTAAERNLLAGYGYFAEEGCPTGTQLMLQHANGTIIEGNFIGTTENGLAAWPNQRGVGGISVETAAAGTIIRNNVISGIAVTGFNHCANQRFGVGLAIGWSSANTTVVGNLIGVGADGATPVPNVRNVSVEGFTFTGTPTNITIGGHAEGEGNVIANAESIGLWINSRITGCRISGNSIHGNGALGIDLSTSNNGAGVSPNDAGDADNGGNGLQNFPVVLEAVTTSSRIRIAGTFNSRPSEAFELEFFASPACDPSGNGEGQTYLGFITVATDASGNAVFGEILNGGVPAGSYITATATRLSTRDTSEFSGCTAATTNDCEADFNFDGFVSGIDYDEYVVAFESGYPSADFDGDGFITGIDFDLYVEAFQAGC